MPPFLFKVTETDSVYVAAEKIFNHYEVGMSATIVGFEIGADGEVASKGEMVVKQLIMLDKVENFTMAGSTKGNGARRHRKTQPNFIGDYLRDKTFKWVKRIFNNQIEITIWRIQ